MIEVTVNSISIQIGGTMLITTGLYIVEFGYSFRVIHTKGVDQSYDDYYGARAYVEEAVRYFGDAKRFKTKQDALNYVTTIVKHTMSSELLEHGRTFLGFVSLDAANQSIQDGVSRVDRNSYLVDPDRASEQAEQDILDRDVDPSDIDPSDITGNLDPFGVEPPDAYYDYDYEACHYEDVADRKRGQVRDDQ